VIHTLSNELIFVYKYGIYMKIYIRYHNTELTPKLRNWAAWTTRAPFKIGDKHGYSRRVDSSCSTMGTHRVTLVKNPMISHETGQEGLWVRQAEHIRIHLWDRHSVAVKPKSWRQP